MKILYVPCHRVLEYDELRILRDLGYDVFSIGEYINPRSPQVDMRPALEYDVDSNLLDQYNKEGLSKGFFDKFDCVIVMNSLSFIIRHWRILKNKITILRTIGQSNQNIELQLQQYLKNGLKILRYSPLERSLKNYAGESGIIRFLKYKSDFKPRNILKKYVISFCQSVKQRGVHCGSKYIEELSTCLPFKLFGPNNESYPFFGGCPSYKDQIDELSTNSCYFYTGTHPAQYTLNFIEAMMAGIPIVALGERITYSLIRPFHLETPAIIDMCSKYQYDNIGSIVERCKILLEDPVLNDEISKKQIEVSDRLFSAELNNVQWSNFLNSM
jgi:hypothetical protein